MVFFNGCPHGLWKFSGQALNLSHWNLCHSSSNARSFNPQRQTGDRTQTSAATWSVAVGFLTYCATVGTPIRFCFSFCFLGLHLQHMKVPQLGGELELQLMAYTTATATLDPSCVCNLHHSSRLLQILTHWAGPEMEPKCSWILVGFVTTEPQWEFLQLGF